MLPRKQRHGSTGNLASCAFEYKSFKIGRIWFKLGYIAWDFVYQVYLTIWSTGVKM